ncbi:hypothetical protein SUGI_0423570 [Cryptomeria japonica]|nr:hypothetical protein SUGI_0423570 [Cryptomeria japonica]
MIFPSVICENRYSTCNTESNYTEGSTYSINLNLVLNDLSRNAPLNSGFCKSSHPQSPDKVYGLFQCMGSVSGETCSECLSIAYNMIVDRCANGISGEVWMGDCFLRYDNSSFFSTLNTIFYLVRNEQKVVGNSQGFVSTTSILLSNLSAQAVQNNGSAMESAKYSSFLKVYGLVECLRDFSMEDCRSCLSRAFKPRSSGYVK